MNFIDKLGVVDVTIRDAGYLNNWNFSIEEIFKIVSGLAEVGVEGIEVGYLSDNEAGYLSARCPASLLSDLRNIARSSKIIAMISLSETEFEKILDSRKHLLDLVRIPSTYEQIPLALDVAKIACKLGIQCSINLVNISALTQSELIDAVTRISEVGGINTLYLAESRGACQPDDILNIVALVRNLWKGILGFHGHDNIGLASVNTSVALKAGCDVIDGSINGFGLGGGNTRLRHALTLVENSIQTKRYQYDVLNKLCSSIYISMPSEHSYLYYLSGQKNMAQLWAVPLLEKYGEKTISYLEKIPRKSYKLIDEIHAEISLLNNKKSPLKRKKCLVINNREPYPENTLNDLDDKLETVWYQKAGKDFSLVDALENNKDTQILVTTYMDLNRKNLERLPDLEAIITTTISTHYIDSGYSKDRNIKIFNTSDYTGSSVAEYAVALMMGAGRKLIDISKAVESGDTLCFEYIGFEFRNKQAGIIGFGNIGSYVAKILKALGMNVLFYNRSQKKSDIAQQVDLETLVKTSDVIFTTLPLNNDSKEIMGKKEFSLMKSSAIYVNTSPDEVFDRNALREALLNKEIACAGLDLLDTSPLKNTPNLLMTSRRAWYTQDCFIRRTKMWKQIVSDYLSDKLNNSVNEDFVQITNSRK
ncbi:protein containing D-isomer specific 2-hydroxyacid dehydrogenase, NAD-binding [Candidatus Magnetomorum sp. HK-1]|nr:protein containing D-isomer specific 2-hydroxyacid dehydrogenase, NAD-binding [Candidatus Magnetomorum sp. HK-1]